MNLSHPISWLACAAIVLALAGCMEKFDLSTLPRPIDVAIDTAYVQMYPSYGTYPDAEDIVLGNDELLYVADRKANRIVMMNRAGTVLSTNTILHPIAVAQDSRLDLLVGGVIVASNGDTVGAVFRIHLVEALHRLDLARVDTIWQELARPHRRFPGIAVFGDNTYVLMRTGGNNSSFIDPDARALLFNEHDRLITPIPTLNTRVGSGITDINRPTGIASILGLKDFILTQSSDGVAYGVIWMRYSKTAVFEGWIPKFDPAKPEDRSVDFIRPYRYRQPSAVAVDRVRRDIFVADAELDSIFKFNSLGRFKNESFGFHRSGGVLQKPTGLAFFEKILYILDAGTGQILRFRLTTDVPR